MARPSWEAVERALESLLKDHSKAFLIIDDDKKTSLPPINTQGGAWHGPCKALWPWPDLGRYFQIAFSRVIRWCGLLLWALLSKQNGKSHMARPSWEAVERALESLLKDHSKAFFNYR